jgi:hypothetical protein
MVSPSFIAYGVCPDDEGDLNFYLLDAPGGAIVAQGQLLLRQPIWIAYFKGIKKGTYCLELRNAMGDTHLLYTEWVTVAALGYGVKIGFPPNNTPLGRNFPVSGPVTAPDTKVADFSLNLGDPSTEQKSKGQILKQPTPTDPTYLINFTGVNTTPPGTSYTLQVFGDNGGQDTSSSLTVSGP